MRLDGLLKESKDIRGKIMEQEKYINNFKDDILECLHKIVDYKKLKKNVISLHKVYVKDEGPKQIVKQDKSHKEKDGKKGETKSKDAGSSGPRDPFYALRFHIETSLEHQR